MQFNDEKKQCRNSLFESVVKSSTDIDLKNKSQAYLAALEKKLEKTNLENKNPNIT